MLPYYRPTLWDHLMDDTDEPMPPRYKPGKASRILFISRGESDAFEPVILCWVGEGAEYLGEMGELADTVRGCPAGTWIWEGVVTYTTSYDNTEYDAEPEGEVRPLTDEEWEWLAESPNDAPWDFKEWFDDD